MTDPYKVLGVSPDVSDEDLKRAYRDLARKYHPDNYANNPLADLAAEKMKEINEAYDEVQRIRKGQSASGSSGYGGGSSSYSYTPPNHFADIRRLIQANRITDAEELLNGIPEGRRDAEWHFLKGNVYYTRGWLEEAMRSFNTAAQMDPQNPEYQGALRQMAWQRSNAAGGSYGRYTMRSGCDGWPCDNMCCNLICADCCCEAMGGDLCPCI